MIWSTLGRLIVVPLAVGAAALVALLILLSVGYERFVQATAGATGFEAIVPLFDLLNGGVAMAAAFTVLPALGAVIIGEVARIRSVLYYVITGGVALAIIPLMANLGQQVAGPSAATAMTATWPIFATAGFAGGFIYWLLAGRRA